MNTLKKLFLLCCCLLLSCAHIDGKLAQSKPTFYIYLAGPEVFLDKPVVAGETKKKKIEALNALHDWPFHLIGLYPLDNSIPDFANDFATGMRIYHANIDLMQKADFIAANMVRFRGPSMDVGTAYEMGFMAGANKPVFAYYDALPFYGENESPELLVTRVEKYWQMHPTKPGLDKDGIHVEKFDMIDNLMMVGAYTDTGYEVALSFEQLILNIAAYIQSNNN